MRVSFAKEQIANSLKHKQIEVKEWSQLNVKFGKIIQTESQAVEWPFGNNKLDKDPLDIYNHLRKSGPVPITLINTRDCFAYDLKFTTEILDMGEGREKVLKKEYYFDPDIQNGIPENFKQVRGLKGDADMKDINNLKVGVTCFENFYSAAEMNEMEQLIEETEQKSLREEFLPMTAQKTFTGVTLKRTKFFFGYRYMWTKTQL